uniref:DUF243 domain-containing protein n=1 Tax=Stomoxys calcitrans TaxID=35570 RepID=A0A1I8NXF2_STOCA
MLGLLVLCFVGLTFAAPQGYNYPSPANGFSMQATGGATSADFHNQQPVITKRFFIHSAPEDEDTEIDQRDIVVGAPRKNFNVVFIKSSSARQHKAKIRVIPAVNEDKTVIYVLTKKSDRAEIDAHVVEPATTTTKPEVFFIKYKTNEEAKHAQRNIQAQYDRLGGSSIVSDEGVAPISSVIGSLDGSKQEASSDHLDAANGPDAGNTAVAGPLYLPPAKKQ